MTTPQFKGTKGKWTAKHGQLASGIFADSNKSQIISCDQFTGWLDVEECRANANAVAAVPDMIEALAGFVAVCDSAPPTELMTRIGQACERARTALSRATEGTEP